MLARRIPLAILGLVLGWPAFAVVGYFAISIFSPNHFDRSLEASMTAAFVFGPVGAIVGLFTGFVWGGRGASPWTNRIPHWPAP
jgi:hypothetical protein